jgi:hypothetical protein
VPDDLIADTLIELREQFGAVSCETQTIRGTWTFEAEIFGMISFEYPLMPATSPHVATSFSRIKSNGKRVSVNSIFG